MAGGGEVGEVSLVVAGGGEGGEGDVSLVVEDDGGGVEVELVPGDASGDGDEDMGGFDSDSGFDSVQGFFVVGPKKQKKRERKGEKEREKMGKSQFTRMCVYGDSITWEAMRVVECGGLMVDPIIDNMQIAMQKMSHCRCRMMEMETISYG